MGGGSKKFAPLNLNDIYGKKEVKSKLPTLITKEDKKELPRREMLVLTAQRPNHSFLVAKDEEGKSINSFQLGSNISSPSPLKKEESVRNAWTIKNQVGVVVCKELEQVNLDERANEKAEPKRETPTPISHSKIEGELRCIQTSRPLPPALPRDRAVRDWDDDERSTALLHQQNTEMNYIHEQNSGVNYFSDAYMQYVNDGGEMQYFSDGDDDADCC